MRAGRHVDFVRPARGLRDVRHDAALVEQDATPSLELVADQVALETATGVPAQFRRRHRRDERIGVDLPVRVMERHADLLATVLEDEDVLDATASGEVPVAIGPDLGKALEPFGRQARERSVVLAGVDHYLAEAAPRRPGPPGRKAIFENRGLKPGGGNLGRVLGSRWAQRAILPLR